MDRQVEKEESSCKENIWMEKVFRCIFAISKINFSKINDACLETTNLQFNKAIFMKKIHLKDTCYLLKQLN
jgi:hypothetical protein